MIECENVEEKMRELQEQEKIDWAERTSKQQLASIDAAGFPKRFDKTWIDTLKENDGNRAAFKAVRTYIDAADTNILSGKGLFLAGPVGCGKTALAIAAMKQIAMGFSCAFRRDFSSYAGQIIDTSNHGSECFVRLDFMASIDFMEERRSEMSMDDYHDPDGGPSRLRVIDRITRPSNEKNLRLTLLDDLGLENLTEWGREQMYRLIDTLYRECVAIFITSNITLKDLAEKIGVRCADRLREMCIVKSMTCESWRGK